MSDPLLANRQLVAFASFRGGVGRTLALVHAAAALADAAVGDKPQSERIRVLCLDFDVDGGGISQLLPPPDSFDEQQGWRSLCEAHAGNDVGEYQALLRAALDPETGSAVYRAHEERELFVLPVGGLNDVAHIDTDFRTLLRSPASIGKLDVTPLQRWFRELAAVLREHYTYVLLDLRPGFEDFALVTKHLGIDAVAVFFRASAAHLAAVRRMLALFWTARDPAQVATVGMSHFVPVIPVLGLRPPVADGRIEQLKRFAQREVFVWLNEEREADGSANELRGPAWCELPFDFSVQVGDRLLIDIGDPRKQEDRGAPLLESFRSFTRQLQLLNAGLDPRGALARHERALRDGRTAESFAFLAQAIERRPSDSDLWLRVWSSYRNALESDSSVRQQVLALCERFEKDEGAPIVARFFATLWLSETFEKSNAFATKQRLDAIWKLAASQGLGLDRIDNVLVRLIRVKPVPGESVLPKPEQAARVLTWMRTTRALRMRDSHLFSRDDVRTGLAIGLAKAAEKSADPVLAQEAYEATVRLLKGPDERSRCLLRYGKFLERHLRHSEAAAVYELAVNLETADREVAHARLAALYAGTAPVSQARSMYDNQGDFHYTLGSRGAVVLYTSSEAAEIRATLTELTVTRSLEPRHYAFALTALLRLNLLDEVEQFIARAPLDLLEQFVFLASADLLTAHRTGVPVSTSVRRWAESVISAGTLKRLDLRVLALASIDVSALEAWHAKAGTIAFDPYPRLQYEIVDAIIRRSADKAASWPSWNVPIRRLLFRNAWASSLREALSKRATERPTLFEAASAMELWCREAAHSPEPLEPDRAVAARMTPAPDASEIRRIASAWSERFARDVDELSIGERVRSLVLTEGGTAGPRAHQDRNAE